MSMVRILYGFFLIVKTDFCKRNLATLLLIFDIGCFWKERFSYYSYTVPSKFHSLISTKAPPTALNERQAKRENEVGPGNIIIIFSFQFCSFSAHLS